PGEAVLGAVSLLYVFAATAFLAKIARRPGVLFEELRILPGRAGVAAASLCILLLAGAVVPHAPGLALGLLYAGVAVHVALAITLARLFLTGPEEVRTVNPAWHLHFVGLILTFFAGVPLGQTGLVWASVVVSIPAALLILTASAVQFARRIPPAPLRPLMAIHLAPPSLIGLAFVALGHPVPGLICACMSAVVLVVLLGSARWLTAAGFSALWGAFTFPMANAAGIFLMQGGVWVWAGAAVLVAAAMVIPAIAFKVLQLWARGTLAAKTNAATA
ncbi:MAG TPA: tellurium resistance protein, partial [Paracoccaceae bacterium]|nr:tellurium resistance protein [Paracoccaceae bacterium]